MSLNSTRSGFVYIMTNDRNTTLYVGVTSDLPRRIVEHKEKRSPKSFTSRYNLTKLVYFCEYQSIQEAISSEKRLKKWKRNWKNELISKQNPSWIDLYPEALPHHCFMQ